MQRRTENILAFSFSFFTSLLPFFFLFSLPPILTHPFPQRTHFSHKLTHIHTYTASCYHSKYLAPQTCNPNTIPRSPFPSHPSIPNNISPHLPNAQPFLELYSTPATETATNLHGTFSLYSTPCFLQASFPKNNSNAHIKGT